MKTKLVHTALAATLVASLVFITIQTSGSMGLYDPWVDLNGDGVIDIFDAIMLANAFGTSGMPINKTFVLLEIQNNLGTINKTLEIRFPQRGITSIPAAAFVPGGYPRPHGNWSIYHSQLVNWDSTSLAEFYAPVQLPHGVTVVTLTTYWFDLADLDDVICHLYRDSPEYGVERMTEASSSGSPGWDSSTNSTIDFATIDNIYQYFMWVRLPSNSGGSSIGDGAFRYAVIEYNYPA